MLFAYLSVILVMLFVGLDAQFGFGWEALLKSPAGDRAEAIADAISLHLASAKQPEWTEVLADFGNKYGVKFYVFDMFGSQLAGTKVMLPLAVTSHLKNELPPPPEAIHGAFSIPPPHLHAYFPPPHFERGPHMQKEGGQGFKRRFGVLHPLGLDGFYSISAVPQRRNSDDANSPLFSPPPLRPLHHHERDKFIAQSNQSLWICMPIRISLEDCPFPVPAFLIAESSIIWRNKLLFDFELMGMALFGFIIFSVIFWWPFVYKITRRLSVLTVAAENIAHGNFTTSFETGLNDEIGRLSATIKAMADRLNGFMQGQKRLLGDISHELITPLARLDMALELFESSDTKDRAVLIADIKDEVNEMGSMVDELLAFAKAGLQNKQLELQPVNVRGIVEKVILQLSSNKLIEDNTNSESTVLADPTLLLRAISNVLRNSIRYAGDSGPISIGTIDGEQSVTIKIADRGPGVPEEILSTLGEPFFRPEFSRNRDSGGVGLGLAIVKSCIECCGGTVRLSNRAGGGLQTEICLEKFTNSE